MDILSKKSLAQVELGHLPPKSQDALDAFKAFLITPLESTLNRFRTVSPDESVLELFHRVVRSVPAYQQFLAEYQIDPLAIQTVEDFHQLPMVTKANYAQRYPLPQRCWEGQLHRCDMLAMSSGSTGQPTVWPRFMTHELEIATRFEQIFQDSFQSDQKPTLAIVCFALGTWVGGMYTADGLRYIADKGYPLTVVTPGNNKPEIFRVLQELGGFYEQVVLLGYPPFLKDVVDSGIAQGIAWAPYNIKLVLAGEVISEEWRTLMGERLGTSRIHQDASSMYGTADAGVLGNETPISICIRRFLAEHPDIAHQLFGESRLPTLVQYDPLSRYFEVEDGTLLFSGNNGVPLIRYHIADKGGILTFEAMVAFLAEHGFDPRQVLPDGIPIREMPFVYVFGRSDFTVSYFGANVYPENVTVALEQSVIQDWVTGKFVMMTMMTEDQDSRLKIVVELAPGVEDSSKQADAIGQSVVSQLRRLNSEFAHYVPAEYQYPLIELRAFGDPEYFPIGVKHRYTRK